MAGITLSGRHCLVCQSPARNEIDAALLQGTGSRKIAADYGITRSSVQRHAKNHLTAGIRAARAAEIEAKKLAELERGRAARREQKMPMDQTERDMLLTQANAALARADAVGQLAKEENIIGSVSVLRFQTMRLLNRAANSGDLRSAVAAVNAAQRCLETMAKLSGQLEAQGTTTITVLNNPTFVTLRNQIVAALQPHPEALRAVLLAIGQTNE